VVLSQKIEIPDGRGLFPLIGEFAGLNRNGIAPKESKPDPAPKNNWPGFTMWEKAISSFRLDYADK